MCAAPPAGIIDALPVTTAPVESFREFPDSSPGHRADRPASAPYAVGEQDATAVDRRQKDKTIAHDHFP